MSDKPIDCEQALRQVFEYIDHELDDGERRAMQHHLETCRSCFSRVEFEQRLKHKLGELRAEEPSSGITDRIRSMIRSF